MPKQWDRAKKGWRKFYKSASTEAHRTHLWFAWVRQTAFDIWHNKTQYCLGCFACFIVVFTVALVTSTLGNVPVVLLRLAELQSGEIDIEGTSFFSESGINYTTVDSILQSLGDRYSFSTARYSGDVLVSSCPRALELGLDPFDQVWKYEGVESNQSCRYNVLAPCFVDVCMNDTVVEATAFVINTERESEIDLGREWNLPRIETAGHAYVTSQVLSQLNAQVGDVIYVIANGRSLLRSAWSNNFENVMDQTGQEIFIDEVYLPIVVEDSYTNERGKYASSINNAVLFEFDTFHAWFAQQLNPAIAQYQNTSLAQFQSLNLYDFVDQVIVNLPPPRVDQYLSSNYDTIQGRVAEFGSTVAYFLGFDQIRLDTPVVELLSETRFFGLFLGLLLNIVIFILLFLSITLIYSLLLVSVETRTWELGVYRMIGTSKIWIIVLLLMQAFSYAIPAWAIGLVLAQGFQVLVSMIFEQLTSVPIDNRLSDFSIWLSTLLGLSVPILASIFPIRAALGQNLHDALDTRRSKTKAVEIKIERSEGSASFSKAFFITGLLMAAFGFFIYYIFPLSLLSFNFTLLLNIFFFLLIGMLLGLTLLSLNLQYLLESTILDTCFWWDRKAIQKIIAKNLIAHRKRNRKTTIMFALSLSFIIFLAVSFTLNIDTFIFSTQQQNGAFIRVSARAETEDGVTFGIRPQIRDQLEQFCSNSPLIESCSFISLPLDNVVENQTRISITNLGHFFFDNQRVWAVSPNFYDTTISNFLQVSTRRANPFEFSVAEELYSIEGSSSMVIGALYETELSLSPNEAFIVEQVLDDGQLFGTTTQRRRFSGGAFLDLSPAFVFSQFPAIRNQDNLVSFTTFVRLSQGQLTSVDEIPMGNMLVKARDQEANGQVDEILDGLQEIIQNEDNLSTFDYRDEVRPIETANTILTLFFLVLAIIAMVISFFSLTSSMYTNINEQTKEIGVLRAIGISRYWMYRIYIYEAFIVITSSSMLGVVIGTVVAYTMTIQRQLFTQLPVPFNFPWPLLIVIFLISLCFAFCASYAPIRRVLRTSTIDVLRK